MGLSSSYYEDIKSYFSPWASFTVATRNDKGTLKMVVLRPKEFDTKGSFSWQRNGDKRKGNT